MRKLIYLLLLLPCLAWGASCPVTQGGITLSVNQPRTSGVSPFLAFFEATATTTTNALTGAGTVPQDIQFTWSFGDPNASGTGTWAYGARPNLNSMNVQNGGIAAAHLYVLPINGTTDTTYTAQVWAYDGTSTATCTVTATANAPSGTNGFSGTNTTCVAQNTTPVAGSGGCPSGAAVLQQSSFATAIGGMGSNKRILFKCGDTFTGSNVTLSGTKWSIGAYGGCEGTTTNRPIFSNTSNGVNYLSVNNTAGDGRITDIDFEGTNSPNLAVNSLWNVGGVFHVPYQITLSNLKSNNNQTSFAWAQGAQWGLINSVQTNATGIGVYPNYNQNNPPYSGDPFNNLDYQALIGNSITGTNSGSNTENTRVGACRFCVISNNYFNQCSASAALLKLHNGNTNNTVVTWTGIYTEYVEVSDNFFDVSGGGQLAEVAPQNGGVDERLRFNVIERNHFHGSGTAQGGRQLLISSSSSSVRNNVFYMQGNSSTYPQWGAQLTSRGSTNQTPTAMEAYNNTCYAPANVAGQLCIGLDGTTQGTAAGNSFALNNLFYIVGGGHSTIVNNGTGNTVSNNTATPTNNPSFTNGSTTFSNLGDFKPTANFSGGACTPNYFDAFNFSRVGACTQIGAITQVAPAQ
jgi:hypothetical protein